MAGAAEAVTDPPATLRAHMIADLANFVPRRPHTVPAHFEATITKCWQMTMSLTAV
eukprot:COSAG04_NODE_2550_length_3949_cov_3.795325_3_plen_56_part_00